MTVCLAKTLDLCRFHKWGPHENYDACDTWCQDRRNCAGYARLGNVCYFKNKDCKNDLFKNGGRSTFLLIGKHLAFNQIL